MLLQTSKHIAHSLTHLIMRCRFLSLSAVVCTCFPGHIKLRGCAGAVLLVCISFVLLCLGLRGGRWALALLSPASWRISHNGMTSLSVVAAAAAAAARAFVGRRTRASGTRSRPAREFRTVIVTAFPMLIEAAVVSGRFMFLGNISSRFSLAIAYISRW